MFFKLIFLTVVLNFADVKSKAALSEEFVEEFANSGSAPFFEIPCMAVGGTCARSVACPQGTKVGEKGLCPVQQDLGMECCKPPKSAITCHSRGGQCVKLIDYKCPRPLKIKEATDCAREQICCVFVK